MPRRTLVGALAAAAVIAALAAGTAFAQFAPFDKRTYFTFSGPVAVPGVTLPAGKYIFRLADTTSRNVVQVLSSDGRTSYAMFFALRAQRMDATEQPEIRFMETAYGMPAAVDTWWYPAERTGYEFVYPKEQARLLTLGTGQQVQMVDEPPYDTEGQYSRLYADGAAVVAETPRYEEAPYDTEGQYSRLYGDVAPQSAEPPAELPRTASALPFATLAGAILLAGAALVDALRRART